VLGVSKHISRRPQQVFAVTALPASLRDDQEQRMHRYLLSMGIRTGCFVLAVLTLAVMHWTVVGWIFVIAAIVLPYIAVVAANATRPPGSATLPPMTPNDGGSGQLSPRRPDEEPR
jgi:hypothetical protein